MRPFVLIALSILFTNVSWCYAAPKNKSHLLVSVPKSGKKTGVHAAKICQGTVPSNVDLASIGLSSDDLKRGVACVADDFTGNGWLDFLIYGAYVKTEGRRYSLVILYDGSSATKTQLIPGALEAFKDTDPERNNYPKYKSSYGLIKHAEGDRGIVYFFNRKTMTFKKVPYVYPKDYEIRD